MIRAGKRVGLRPVLQSDYQLLYVTSVADPVGWRWKFRGATPSPEMFGQLLWEGVLCQQLAVDLSTLEPQALVSLYSHNHRSRSVYLSSLAVPSARPAAATDATLLLLDMAFRQWELRKVYIETLAFNLTQFGGIQRFAVEEGRLRDHEWHDGAWWDLVTLALYRDSWKINGARLADAVSADVTS